MGATLTITLLFAEPALSDKTTNVNVAPFWHPSAYPALSDKSTKVNVAPFRFRFRAGKMRFLSRRHEWLVVAPGRAAFSGTGSINGEGEFRLVLSVIDGEYFGDGIDRIRIRITDAVDGTVIYDNQPGAGVDADATTEIRGGSIVVHQP
jgi:hypothetical protein